MAQALSIWRRPFSIKAMLQQLLIPLSVTDPTNWPLSSSFTGKSVSQEQALRLSTAGACIRLLAGTLGTLPCGFYRRNADGSRDAATNQTLYEILHHQPNADMVASVFWECVVASLLMWGNAYVEIVRSGNTVVSLMFLSPSRISSRQLKGGAREYKYADSAGGTPRTIAAENMMHIPAFSIDGVTGLSPLSYGVNVLGAAIETDRASSETFGNANRATGMINTGGKFLTNAQREMYRAHLAKVSADGGVYIFEGGTKFDSFKFNPVDAELLASRGFNVEEICRLYGVDPAMVGHGGKDSNWGTGLEQKMLWFLVFALRKWCVRIEQGIRKSLLTPVERKTYFAEFNMEGLLRGDSAARASYFSVCAQNGLKTRNEMRRLDNEPPLPGGDVLTVQSNLVPLAQLGMQPSPDSNGARDAILAWLGMNRDAKE